MSIHVLLFASFRELAGRESLEVECAGSSSVGTIWNALCAQYPALARQRSVALFARNGEYVRPETFLEDGDELAVFPPVSGGCGSQELEFAPDEKGDIFQVVDLPIPVLPLVNHLTRPEDGAVVTFLGTVRNNTKGEKTIYLEYEGFRPMALAKIREIGERIRARWAVGRIGIVHRLGRLEIGEASVAIVITSPHRKAAFEACQFAIDTLKMIVPIWKKEHFVDGAVWVEGKHLNED